MSAAHVPHVAYNLDTEQALASIRKLAALDPLVVGVGHFGPMRGPGVRAELEAAAASLCGMSQTGREIQLAARPHGEPTPDDFRLAEAELPEPADGQVLVRNLLMSVDPYMRGRMNDVQVLRRRRSRLGAAARRRRGRRGGRVAGPTVSPSATSCCTTSGWREYAVARRRRASRRVDPERRAAVGLPRRARDARA